MIDTIIEGMNVLKLIGCTDDKQQQPLLEVLDLPNRGRGYVATQDIEAGTLIHISDPLAMVVNQEWMPETCMGCFDFSYPKRMKTKALSTTEETRALLQWWQQQQQQQQQKTTRSKNDKLNNAMMGPLTPLRHIAFCTDQCKQDYVSTCSNEEWYTWLTCMYRLENYDSQQPQCNNNEADSFDDLVNPSTIFHDDIALRIYLDKVWQLALGSQNSEDTNQDDFDDADRTMCRFIASCLVKRKMATTENDTASHVFDTLWTMQDNELGHFRHFYQHQQREQDTTALPTSTSSSTSSSSSVALSTSTSESSYTSTSISTAASVISSQLNKGTNHHHLHHHHHHNNNNWRENIPAPIMQTIQLYRHFVSAMTQPMKLSTKGITVTIPPGLSLTHQDITSDLFRAIYYREMANSFGLWEQPQSEQQQHMDLDAATMVTDDLELLGFGIYPSAVYFNHACQANAIKLRHKSRMHFYTRQCVLKGEEVCISYGNVDAPCAERQQRLLDHYYFTCACTKCRLEQQQQQ